MANKNERTTLNDLYKFSPSVQASILQQLQAQNVDTSRFQHQSGNQGGGGRQLPHADRRGRTQGGSGNHASTIIVMVVCSLLLLAIMMLLGLGHSGHVGGGELAHIGLIR